MKRLLTLHLHATGCAADASLNGITLASVTAPTGRPHSTALPVHEFLLRGLNRLTLRVDPASVDPMGDAPAAAMADVADGAAAPQRTVGATLTLRLANTGSADARVLARADWSTTAPFETDIHTELPIDLPRWRWLDVPPLPAASLEAVRHRALQALQQQVLAFRRGSADGWLALTRLALEERALAYGTDARLAQAAFLDRLRAAPDGQPWLWHWPSEADIVLHPEANGRLLSCLHRGGGPALHAASRDGRHAWVLPLRLAWLDEGLHGLR